ncbi:MAG: ATP-binding protein [Clostridia bacterium]|nr:ATP-binding protein [Clostridia bacterium]
MKTYAFVGPSGTGKSYRAQMVANENGIKYIIDDGLLICENEVLAGISAKKAPTKIETVRNALFSDEEQRKEIKRVIKKNKPDSILILGTSDEMVKRIAENLSLLPIEKIIYITDVATEEEIKMAKNIRVTQGKHVIPVPTFAIKKDFSGFLLDPLQIFKSTGKGKTPYISEKTIIRPTFSYLGNFEISDIVFKQIIECVATKVDGIYKIPRIIIKKHDGYNDGIYIYLEPIIEYGFSVNETMITLKKLIKKEIEKLTAMNVLNMEIVIKSVHYEKK